MYGFEDMKRDFEDGRLKEFVVVNNCQETYWYAFNHQGETLSIVDIKMRSGEYSVYFKEDVAIGIKHIDFEATEKLVIRGDKMKFKKEDLTTRHILQLRRGKLYALVEWKGYNELHCVDLKGVLRGRSNLEDYYDNLKSKERVGYDIVKIKECENTQTALDIVKNGKSIEEWDWESEDTLNAKIKYKEMQNNLNELQSKMEKFANENNLA